MFVWFWDISLTKTFHCIKDNETGMADNLVKCPQYQSKVLPQKIEIFFFVNLLAAFEALIIQNLSHLLVLYVQYLDPFYIGSRYIKVAKTSWTYSIFYLKGT